MQSGSHAAPTAEDGRTARRPQARDGDALRRRSTPRMLAAVVGVLALMFMDTACGGTQIAATPTTSPPTDFSGRVDIGGGRMMYLECRGSGSPTVVLVSGSQIAGDLWDSPLGRSPTVFPTVAATTRVCAYDRPGTTRARPDGGESRSDPVTQPTTTRDAVADLHALLVAARQAPPYVLVAHSYGGLISRLYAHTYPSDVAGMVLVDSFSPELRQHMTAEQWATWKIVNATRPTDIASYPALERMDFDTALQQVQDARSIPQMPLVVLTADAAVDSSGFPPGVPASFATVIENAQHAAQRDVAELVRGARWITDTHSGHNIMLDNPQLVSDAVDGVVQAVRQGRTTMAG